MQVDMLNLFEIYYDSGTNYKECKINGPAAVEESLKSYGVSELQQIARQLAIPTRALKPLKTVEKLKNKIVRRVTDIATQCSAFGDY